MPTLTFKATEMKNAKVAHISLVERAATRIPFRVIKQEKPMNGLKSVDLASVFKREKPAPVTEVVGLITMKSDAFDKIKGQFVEAGFSVEKSQEMEDGSVVFAQADDVSGESILLRISEDAALAVKDFTPYDMDITTGDGESFASVCKTQGFYPGVGTTIDVLRQSVLSLAEGEGDAAEKVSKVNKMFDEAKQYAASLLQALPTKAFKLEFVGVTDEEPDPVVAEPAVKEEPKEEVKEPASADPAPADPVADPAPEAPAAVEPVAKADVPEAPVQPTIDVADLQDKIVQALAKKFDESLSAVTAAVKDLSTRVEDTEKVAKEAKDAVQGTIVMGGGAPVDPQPVARKSEGYRGREIDTGFARHRASR